ncbi:MAG TPA: ABC transporter ATP-binding protein [Bacilli bacterium]|nr:ABC transporter ATP-binding protein [Bacilli bacterium]
MSEMVIETWGLTKQYEGRGGFRDITLQVPRGIVYGFLGPNGAGKSTFVRTMLGLLHPTGGRAQMLGRPIGDPEARRKVGYLPELFRYQDWLTGRQLLEMHASLAGVARTERKRRIDTLLERVGLSGREGEKIKGYSKGMQQRIGLACALLADPDLIFLDEPTSALDPIGRRDVRDLIVELREQGKTIFLNSHLLNEVESVCDQVAIIHRSDMIVQGDWRRLSDVHTQVVVRATGLTEAVWQQLSSLVLQAQPMDEAGSVADTEAPTRWMVQVEREESLPLLVQRLSELGVLLYELTPQQPHLEDVFLHWVQGKEGQPHVDDRQVVL